MTVSYKAGRHSNGSMMDLGKFAVDIQQVSDLNSHACYDIYWYAENTGIKYNYSERWWWTISLLFVLKPLQWPSHSFHCCGLKTDNTFDHFLIKTKNFAKDFFCWGSFFWYNEISYFIQKHSCNKTMKHVSTTCEGYPKSPWKINIMKKMPNFKNCDKIKHKFCSHFIQHVGIGLDCGTRRDQIIWKELLSEEHGLL